MSSYTFTPHTGAHAIKKRVVQLGLELAEVRPSKPRASRMKSLEALGAERLAEPVAETPSRGKWYVRVIYRSMGDELLAFDWGPMNQIAADNRRAEFRGAAITFVWCRGEEKILPHSEVRVVELPSQAHARMLAESAALAAEPEKMFASLLTDAIASLDDAARLEVK